MPTRPPVKSDFPSSLTLTITPPPAAQSTSNSASNTNRPPPNILLLLHGLGDTSTPFTNLASSLRLAETTILTVQAPNGLPFDLPGFHWGDDMQFDSRTGALDMDAGFTRSTKLMLEEIIKDVLVRKCGYKYREIMIMGFGQGGMAGLVVAERLFSTLEAGQSHGPGGGELAGVISIGAPYPLSLAGKNTSSGKGKSRTPVLVLAGRDSEVVTESAVKRTKDVFEFVEVHAYSRRGDTMPRSRDEMVPIMRFFARRLRSWQGVPEGSVEIS